MVSSFWNAYVPSAKVSVHPSAAVANAFWITSSEVPAGKYVQWVAALQPVLGAGAAGSDVELAPHAAVLVRTERRIGRKGSSMVGCWP